MQIVAIGSGFPDVHKDIIGIIYFWGLVLFFMVYGSWSLKIVDIYYENDLTLFELCFSRKGVKWYFMGRVP
jgi:hypothetical protein